MEQNQGDFQPQNIVEFSDGTEVIPESPKEESFLVNLANNPTINDKEKERIAKLGTLIAPQAFDVNFAQNQRDKLPTDLDPQLREMIRRA